MLKYRDDCAGEDSGASGEGGADGNGGASRDGGADGVVAAGADDGVDGEGGGENDPSSWKISDGFYLVTAAVLLLISRRQSLGALTWWGDHLLLLPCHQLALPKGHELALLKRSSAGTAERDIRWHCQEGHQLALPKRT